MSKTVIAFVDDQPEIVSSLKRIYRNDRKTTEVFITTSQQALLDFVRDNQVHVVVSDMQMPGMSGSDLLKQVRHISPNTIRILLTGFAEKNNILKCINEAQAFRFMTKPWNNNELKEKINLSAEISKELYAYKVDPELIDYDNSRSVLFVGNKKEALYQQIMGQVDQAYTALTPSESVMRLVQYPNIKVLILHEKSYVQKNIHSHYNHFLTLIKHLKNKRPNLISIVIGNFNDADTAIELINEGQIFRLLEEPLGDLAIQTSIDEALKYADLLSQHPELIAQHVVDEIDEQQIQALEQTVDISIFDTLNKNISILMKKIPFLSKFLSS